MSPRSLRFTLLVTFVVGGVALALAMPAVPAVPAAPAPPERKRSSWPMFGGSHSRNMANLTDKNIPHVFDHETGENILWKVDLGSKSHPQPVVANGRVYVGTNNQRPRNNRDTERNKQGEVEPIDRGILMCFDAGSGKFLWQAVHKKLESGRVNDWPEEGIASAPAVEGDRVYYVSNRAEVVCVDANGFADGNQGFQGEKFTDATDADIIWSFDMIKELDVFPHNLAMCPPLVVGDLVFVVTGNGVDDGHLNLPSPKAPSFIALNKNTGKLVWKDNSPGMDIMHGQWSAPSYTDSPVPQVIFPGGDGWLRAFDPPTGKLLWKFHGNRSDAKYELGGTGDRNDFVNNAPVIHNGHVYIGTGQDPEHSTGIAYFWCIDLVRAIEFGAKNKNADVSPVNDNFDPKAAVNKNTALAWVLGGEDTRKNARRDFIFGRTMSSACIVGDVLYAAELAGFLHCLDARTGKRYWCYDTKSSIWGSPYYVDGKVFLATDSGELFIFRHSEKPDVETDPEDVLAQAPNLKAARPRIKDLAAQLQFKVLIGKIELDAPIRSTPTVANGVLFVNTEKTLYAIARTP